MRGHKSIDHRPFIDWSSHVTAGHWSAALVLWRLFFCVFGQRKNQAITNVQPDSDRQLLCPRPLISTSSSLMRLIPPAAELSAFLDDAGHFSTLATFFHAAVEREVKKKINKINRKDQRWLHFLHPTPSVNRINVFQLTVGILFCFFLRARVHPTDRDFCSGNPDDGMKMNLITPDQSVTDVTRNRREILNFYRRKT